MDFRHRLISLLDEIASLSKPSRHNIKVTLVAVTKTFPPEVINRYLEESHDLFTTPVIGENRVQEILNKKPKLLKHSLHLIGHLQKNKARQILPHIDCLHSLDSKELADTLEKELSSTERELPVLLQANTSGELSKFGGDWEATRSLLLHALRLPHLRVVGLMTMAPLVEDREVIRNCFRTLREWRDRLEEETGKPLPELSMGMSHDYRIALEEGATMVRIGSALFGDRDDFRA